MFLISSLRPLKNLDMVVWFSSLIPALFNGRGPSTTLKEGQPQRPLGPTTRAMTKRLDEDWNKATDGRETYLYMFQESPKSSVA